MIRGRELTMSGSKRRTFLKSAGVAGLTALSGCTGGKNTDDGSDKTDKEGALSWKIGGSQQGSPANTWVQGFAQTMDKHSDTLSLSPTLVPGWQRAIAKISNGELDVSTSWNHFAYEAQNNLEYFSEGGAIGPVENEVVQIFPTLHQGHWWLATYADSDIESVKDLKGKRVGLNLRGESPTKWAKVVLKAAGVADSIQYSYFNFPDSGRAIRNRTVDAVLVLAINGAILPAPHAEAFSSVKMKDVKIPDDVKQKAKELSEVIQFGAIKNANLNQKGEFKRADSMLQVSSEHTRADKKEENVYHLVSTIIDNQDELGQYHPALKAFGIGKGRHNFTGVVDGTKFHPGAVKYFKENSEKIPNASFEGNQIRIQR